MPVIVSGVVVTILVAAIIGFDSGYDQSHAGSIGITKSGWLVNPDIAIYSIAIMATWKNVGLYVILFLWDCKLFRRNIMKRRKWKAQTAGNSFIILHCR